MNNISKIDAISSSLNYESTIRELESVIETDNSATFLSDITSALGFDGYFLYSCNPVSLANPRVYVDSNHSPNWNIRYKNEKLFLADPSVHYLMGNTQPIRWDHLLNLEEYAGDIYQEFSELRKHYGQVSGVTFPFSFSRGNYTLLNLSSRRSFSEMENQIQKGFVLIPWLSANILKSSQNSLVHRNEIDYMLTKREKECLFWACEGKTAWEIGKIFDISARTINFHLKNGTQKLGASNRQHAVAKAMMFGIIKPALSI